MNFEESAYLPTRAQLRIEKLRAIFERLGPSYVKVLENPGLMLDALGTAVVQAPPSPDDGSVDSPSQEFDQTQLRIDSYQAKFIDEVIGKNVHGVTTVPQPLVAFQRFQEGVARGKAPAPITIGRLIQSLGRLGELNKVGKAYMAAQTVLQSLELNEKWQSKSWFMIEDSMITRACRRVDSAHVHWAGMAHLRQMRMGLSFYMSRIRRMIRRMRWPCSKSRKCRGCSRTSICIQQDHLKTCQGAQG
jgi:hypothetical protein